MFQTPIVMLDFETTGLSPAMGDRITEVAALRMVDGRVVERFVSLVNCGVRIPAFITQLTGITQSMVDSAPPARQVVPRLVEFIGGDALAAHNASFDAKFLLAESDRLGLRSGHGTLVCSLLLARRVLPGQPSYSLGNLARSLGIPFAGTAHRAEADAEVSAGLLHHIGRRLCADYDCPPLEAATLAAINRQSAKKTPAFLQKTLAPAALPA